MPDLATCAARLQAFKTNLPYYVGDVILEFILDNFDRQAWAGKAWKPRKNNSGTGRSLLVKTGRGRRSIRVTRRTEAEVAVGTDLSYMAAHNTGANIKVRVTAKSRKFFWAMFKATGQGYWKGMALTKKTHLVVVMPERRFLGPSKELDQRMARMLDTKLNQVFT